MERTLRRGNSFCMRAVARQSFSRCSRWANISLTQELIFFGIPAGDTRFAPPALPTWLFQEDLVYGMPDIEGRGLKIAFDEHGERVDPDTQSRIVSAAGAEMVRKYVARRFPALRDAPIVETRVCQYENTSNGDFLIEPASGNGERVVCRRRLGAWVQAWTVGGGVRHWPVARRHRSRGAIFAGNKGHRPKARGILRSRSEGELPVETSGRGVRLVIKGWFFVCLLTRHITNKKKSGPASEGGTYGHLGRAKFREKCRLERIANYGGTMRFEDGSIAQVFVLLRGDSGDDDGGGRRVRQDIKIAYEKFVLPNGLTVMSTKIGSADRGSEHLVSRGLEEREAGKTGFAHLFETLDVRRQPKNSRGAHRSDGARGRDGPQRHDRFRRTNPSRMWHILEDIRCVGNAVVPLRSVAPRAPSLRCSALEGFRCRRTSSVRQVCKPGFPGFSFFEPRDTRCSEPRSALPIFGDNSPSARLGATNFS